MHIAFLVKEKHKQIVILDVKAIISDFQAFTNTWAFFSHIVCSGTIQLVPLLSFNESNIVYSSTCDKNDLISNHKLDCIFSVSGFFYCDMYP